MTLFFTLIAEWNPNAAPPFFLSMRNIDNNMRIGLRTKRIGFGLCLTEVADLLSVSPTTYKKWEDGVTVRCIDNNYAVLRFYLEGLIDPFIKRATFPLSKDDHTFLRKMFMHRAFLEKASPEILVCYKAELATIAIKSI